MNGLDVLQSAGDTLVMAASPIRDALNLLTSQGRTQILLGNDGRALIGTNNNSLSAGSDIWLFAADGKLVMHWKDSIFDGTAFFPGYTSMAARISSDGLRAVSDYKLIDLPN